MMLQLVSNPFSGDGGDDSAMKMYFHPNCLFETFSRARPTTKVIEDADDLEGFTNLKQEDMDLINELIKGSLHSSNYASLIS